MSDLSLGESRVRTSFNPAQDGTVDRIKQKSAELINLISSIEDGTNMKNPAEVGRLKSLAMTSIEEAAMWGVKAATSDRA